MQAVYADQNGQPLYIVQHMNQPTLIPLQAGALSAVTAPNSTVSNSIGTGPNSKLEQSKQSSLTLHTPPPSEWGEGGGRREGRRREGGREEGGYDSLNSIPRMSVGNGLLPCGRALYIC